MEMAKTASEKENNLSVSKKRTPQTMSPTVVGTNSNPAARPQREDCGFEKTILYVARTPPLAFPCGMRGVSFGVIHHKPTATRSTTTPMRPQYCGTDSPSAIQRPTTS